MVAHARQPRDNSELSTDDLDAARGHLAEALDIVRALNDRSGIVYGTFNLGLAEYLGGSPDAAEALFAESLDLAQARPDEIEQRPTR